MSGANHPDLIEKPWGHELIWARTDKYVGKILHINTGHRLSKQYHVVKDETIMLLEGQMVLEIETNGVPKGILMKKWDRYHITPGTIHRMIAITDVDVMEVSTTELEDVIRLEDDYGR